MPRNKKFYRVPHLKIDRGILYVWTCRDVYDWGWEPLSKVLGHVVKVGFK